MNSQRTELKPCPICNGAGKIVTGYSVIYTEIVEKVEVCPACGEKNIFGIKRQEVR